MVGVVSKSHTARFIQSTCTYIIANHKSIKPRLESSPKLEVVPQQVHLVFLNEPG